MSRFGGVPIRVVRPPNREPNDSGINSVEELLAAQERLQDVHVSLFIREYIVSIVNATRGHPDVYLGASPRGSLALYKTARARAAVLGREFVTPDDIKVLTRFTLAHRLIISPAARIKNVSPETVLQEILDSIPIPGARVRVRR